MSSKVATNGYADVRRRCEDLEKRVDKCDQERIEMLETLAEYKVKLEETAKDLVALTPKSINWPRIAGVVLTVLSLVGSSIYVATQQVAARPTRAEVQKMSEPYVQDMRDIKQEQKTQRQILDRVDYSLEQMNEGLKEVREDVKGIRRGQ